MKKKNKNMKTTVLWLILAIVVFQTGIMITKIVLDKPEEDIVKKEAEVVVVELENLDTTTIKNEIQNRKAKENAKKNAEAEREVTRKQYEESKRKWLRENPPVDVLFDLDRIYDEEYVIDYIKRNGITGHCALVWRSDVICVDWDVLTFPTERPKY